MSIRLYSYWRSSAAYRIRIVLNLKALNYETRTVSLAPGESEHRQAAYRDVNPQMLVPFLKDGEIGVAQSLAIAEYLEETYPEVPLLPREEPARSQVRAFCNLIACDIHPLNNLRVTTYLKEKLGIDQTAGSEWYTHWVREGFTAAEALCSDGPYVMGSKLTLADAFLVPQMYNAHRFDVPVADFPRLTTVVDACNALHQFAEAAPERQPDATTT